MLASMILWIWCGEPAVILEIVQQASFRIPSLGEDRRERRAGKAPDEMTTWVWRSSPVTMFPTDRRAGVWTAVDGCLNRVSAGVMTYLTPPISDDSHEKVYKTSANARLDDGLDLVVGPVRKV